MNETANSEGASESEKPVQSNGVQFPPFPDPTDNDFDEDIEEDERNYYKTRFKDLNLIKSMRLHCTACDRHMGCSARSEERMRTHPMLRTLMCHTCHTFYNSGEFEKGDDGSELYCRWCGQGGQVYCCADCPHVFCAKCIKRNLGIPKIKEIENADDWKCFKCNSKCLWDLRALCWAVLRYCQVKKQITYKTEDPELKQAYQADCNTDHTECCRKVRKKPEKKEVEVKKVKKEKEKDKEKDKPDAATIISKIPSTIQVKKFASVKLDENTPEKKKANKRPLSPKNKPIMIKNPVAIAPAPRMINPMSFPSQPKKIRLPPMPMLPSPIRLIPERRGMSTYTRIRPKPPTIQVPLPNNTFNGYANLYNDNINLSLESLTQGLDMSAVMAAGHSSQDDDVVCTPDFPMEPLCELQVTEDNDDDVQCITPGPVAVPKIINPPPLVPRGVNSNDLNSENIVQMTENDVTVNETTGGLKFRVDPQTLSSNKMYRLPDGRIFAINANPNMPGGYSATIVAVTESSGKAVPKGATYAAKLSAITSSTPANRNQRNNQQNRSNTSKHSTPKQPKPAKNTEKSPEITRECDLKVPVEWYRYNLIDAIDALEYALSRLNKLKKEATSVYLRSRSIGEMRVLHKSLERLLSTSSKRFGEVKDNLNNGFKQYITKKTRTEVGGDVSDDDDDVEILPNMDEDPIFIDENSMDSNNQEVDLTGAGSSEYNDSGDKNENCSKNGLDTATSENENENCENEEVIVPDTPNHIDDISCKENNSQNIENRTELDETSKPNDDKVTTDSKADENQSDPKENKAQTNSREVDTEIHSENIDTEINSDNDNVSSDDKKVEKENEKKDKDVEKENEMKEKDCSDNVSTNHDQDGTESEKSHEKTNREMDNNDDDGEIELSDLLGNKTDSQDNDDKMQDTEMTEELIATLLNDNTGDTSMDVSQGS